MELRKNFQNPKPEIPSTPRVEKPINEILEHHLKRNTFKVGDKVVFKKPKRNKVYGIISEIQTDPEKVTWTRGNTVPNYISVTAELVSKTNGKMLIQMKTYESKIMKDRRT